MSGGQVPGRNLAKTKPPRHIIKMSRRGVIRGNKVRKSYLGANSVRNSLAVIRGKSQNSVKCRLLPVMMVSRNTRFICSGLILTACQRDRYLAGIWRQPISNTMLKHQGSRGEELGLAATKGTQETLRDTIIPPHLLCEGIISERDMKSMLYKSIICFCLSSSQFLNRVCG